MLGHMQKVNHFWAQIEKTQNVSYNVFAQSLQLLLLYCNNYWLSLITLDAVLSAICLTCCYHVFFCSNVTLSLFINTVISIITVIIIIVI